MVTSVVVATGGGEVTVEALRAGLVGALVAAVPGLGVAAVGARRARVPVAA